MKITKGDKSDLEIFFLRHNGRLEITFSQLEYALNGWDIYRLEDENKPIAVIVSRNGHGHISAYAEEKVGISKMKWALKELGIKHTTVSNTFTKGHALAKRLGFETEKIENGVTTYVLDHV